MSLFSISELKVGKLYRVASAVENPKRTSYVDSGRGISSSEVAGVFFVTSLVGFALPQNKEYKRVKIISTTTNRFFTIGDLVGAINSKEFEEVTSQNYVEN